VNNIKVMSVPHLDKMERGESGIHTIIRQYFKHAPDYGIDFVSPDTDSFDVLAVHAGTSGSLPKNGNIVAHTHGLYFTADYNNMGKWSYAANKSVIDSVRHAKVVTVPSAWVGEIFQRDMRLNPTVLPHGIDADEWSHDYEPENYAIGYAKNRAGVDVCDPSFLGRFARLFPTDTFLTTFSKGHVPNNVKVIGLQPHDKMKPLVQRANVFISTTKETFGIGILEALASGVPVVAFNEGGASFLVQHGVNGYLARPGDYEDLARGYDYCRHNRRDLSHWARESARGWGWEQVMKQLAQIYDAATQPDPPTVAVVIPCHNKVDSLERAVNSALNQTHKPDKVIIADDRSSDGSTEIAKKLANQHETVSYLRCDNGNVALTRNDGIKHAWYHKYIVPLDADDAIEPLFVERCVNALEADNTLAVAYTGLWFIDGDKSGVSDWPDEWDFDKQLKGRNQVPTCAMFRRDMWQRLGGYRARYAPKGAGAEDAEFWLRAGAYGFRAAKVTEEPLFVYTMGQGATSQPGYSEVNWRELHPFTRDGMHPIGSYATPVNHSHPVRQYDRPDVSVIIPVGPGHEQMVINALDSLEAQSFRSWEAIVIMDNWGTPDNDAPMHYRELEAAYPYALFYHSHHHKRSMGAGWARNLGAEKARAPMLLFLDADDTLMPSCIERMVAEWNGMTDEKAVVYSDYYGIADIEDTSQLAPDLQRNIVSRDGHRTVIRYKAGDFNCEQAAQQPHATRPYIWNNVTSLVPKAWHDEIGGFDESMESWEDVLYWWRMAWANKCFVRIDEPLMVYRFATGSRRDTGSKLRADLVSYIQDKKKELDIVCSGCGRKNKSSPSPSSGGAAVLSRSSDKETEMSDENYVLAVYNHRNKGQHAVYGASTNQFYGYHGGGEKFLVHVSDIEANRHLFTKVKEEKKVDVVPQPKPSAPPPPPPTPQEVAAKQPDATEFVQKQIERERLDLQAIPGITDAIAAQMRNLGLTTADEILDYGAEALVDNVKGVGFSRAMAIIAYAEKLAGNGEED
jgi:glycosyltransferase involved in cell wall biosynthesis